MKKNKSWLKEEVKKLATEESQFMPHDEMIDLQLVLLLIDQLEEPQKVVIPEFIADWIESYRGKTLAELIHDVVYEGNKDIEAFRRWFHEEKAYLCSYSEFLARAWLDGYEVEKEKKYTVCFKKDRVGLFLFKERGIVRVGDNLHAYFPERAENQLTEQEIKDYDERFWQFAEEVTTYAHHSGRSEIPMDRAGD